MSNLDRISRLCQLCRLLLFSCLWSLSKDTLSFSSSVLWKPCWWSNVMWLYLPNYWCPLRFSSQHFRRSELSFCQCLCWWTRGHSVGSVEASNPLQWRLLVHGTMEFWCVYSHKHDWLPRIIFSLAFGLMNWLIGASGNSVNYHYKSLFNLWWNKIVTYRWKTIIK
jgi:hypothetical protein